MNSKPSSPTSTSPYPQSASSAQTKSPSASSASKTSPTSPAAIVLPRYWLTIWIAIYALIILLGIVDIESDLLTVIKLGGILLCFAYTVIKFPKDHLLQAAMFTTCIADLVLAGRNTSEAGIIIFFIAQVIHLIRLDGVRLHLPISIFVTVAALCIILDLWLGFMPLIFLVVAFYAATLISNLIISYQWYRSEPRNPRAWFALAGFLLFGCCDLCTVMSYLSLIHFLPAAFYLPANFFAWFFYYPSQIFVSNSSRCVTIDSKEGKCKTEVYGR